MSQHPPEISQSKLLSVYVVHLPFCTNITNNKNDKPHQWQHICLLAIYIHCVPKKVNPTECITEMWNLNESWPKFVQLILRYSVKYAQTRKYWLIAELSIFKYRWQNILVSSTAYCSHSVTLFWCNHINNKHGIFRKHHVLIKVLGQEKGQQLTTKFPNKLWTLKQIVVEDWHRQNHCNHQKEAWQLAAGGTWKQKISQHDEFIDEAVKKWSPHLRASIQAH